MKQYKKMSIVAAIESAVPASRFELTEERIEKMKSYAEVVLEVVRVSTVLTMAVIAPNALQALKIFEKKKTGRIPEHKNIKKKLVRTFHYLRGSGFAKIKERGDDYEIELTDKTKKKIKKIQFDTLTILRPKKWEKKFWQVAVDVPVEKKNRADMLRLKFKEMGLYPLQRSLWFYPHDPRGEIELIGKFYEVAEYITFMRIDKLESQDEKELKNHFRKVGLI